MAEEDKKNPFRERLLIAIGLVILVGAILFVMRHMENVKEFILNSGWIGMLVCVGVYGLLGASPVPSEPLTVLISTIYGPFTATMVAGTGNLLAAMMEYFIGERISNAADFIKQKEKIPFGLGKLPVNSWLFLMVARMIPGYGSKFVSVMGGLYRVPILRYAWTAAIPIYLGSAIFAYGGSSVVDLVSRLLR